MKTVFYFPCQPSKQTIFFCLFFLFSCNTKDSVNSFFDIQPTEREYQLVWSDEFDVDGRPDSSKWTYEHGFVRNEEFQWYQPQNAFVEDGLLVIEGRRDTIPNNQYEADSDDWRKNRKEAYFSSACVITKDLASWRYGIFEFKARIKTEEGLWPAIWSLGLGHEWPLGGEIDIMEFYDKKILANVAWASAQPWTPIWDSYQKPISSFNDPEWSNKFHIWKMEWTTNFIKLYLDDQLLNTTSLNDTYNKRGDIENPFRETVHFLLLNLAIGGRQGGDPTNTAFPTRYEIDYVRVYQKQ